MLVIVMLFPEATYSLVHQSHLRSGAIHDLPVLRNGDCKSFAEYRKVCISEYAEQMRMNQKGCKNHLVTKNADYIVNR
jgi:hypothetical protein